MAAVVDAAMDGPDPDVLVGEAECSNGHPSYWTSDFALYSNATEGNAGMGSDSHASVGEIAGNRMVGKAWTSKFPVDGGEQLLVHLAAGDERCDVTQVATIFE